MKKTNFNNLQVFPLLQTSILVELESCDMFTTSKSDVQVCHQRLISAFDLLLIFLCSLIQTSNPNSNP